MLLGNEDELPQARRLVVTQECLVSDLFHKHGLTDGPNRLPTSMLGRVHTAIKLMQKS